MDIEITRKRINEVLRTDVITSSEADFLCTHVPFQRIEVINGGYSQKDNNPKFLSEESLFGKYIINPKNTHQLIVVRGASGAGKSHLIRWFSARIKQSPRQDEVVLFIRRSDNDLKGTLKQLLNLEEVSNIPNKDTLERLVKASAIINDKKFKDQIFHNLLVEVRNDDSEDLSRVEKKQLENLLMNDLFSKKMLGPGGPIERIYSKVSESHHNDGKDILPLFKTSDFDIDIKFVSELEDNGADKNAVRMADKLFRKPELLSQIVRYLNNFVDPVIQSCAGIEPGDLEDIFNDIRRELLLNGKNLTLLIEDITAFTGVSQALLNVLTTEHTGMNAESGLCRITSIIGTTTAYYEDTFRDNYKDRVSLQFHIHENSIGQDSTHLHEFVGRYINTMSLEKFEVEDWASRGATDQGYPVHNHLHGKDWDTINIKGKTVSLYPFTKKAIENLYSMLPNERKTPRVILREIIERVVNEALHNMQFFPSLSLRELPPWSNVSHGQILYNKIKDEAIRKRYEKLLRVWGDASLFSRKINNRETLGGIGLGVIAELGLPVIDGVQAEDIGEKEETTPDTSGRTRDKIPEELTPIKDVQQDSRIVEYNKEIKLVEEWLAGGMFANFELVRNDLHDFLITAINWQSEGVSYDNILRINLSQRKLVSFERQKLGEKESLLMIKADSEAKSVVTALLAWRYLGNKTWNFNGAAYMVYQLQMWVNKYRNALIQIVQNLGKDRNNYFRLSIINEIYRQLLFGKLEKESVWELKAENLINGKLDAVKHNGHSTEWKQLMDLIVEDQRDLDNLTLLQQYHNTLLGKVERVPSKVYLINYHKVEKELESILNSRLFVDGEELKLNDPIARRNGPRELLMKISARVAKVCEKEISKATELMDQLHSLFLIDGGTDQDDEVIDADIYDFYDKAKIYYNLVSSLALYFEQKPELSSERQNTKELYNDYLIIKSAIFQSDTIDVLQAFSKDPLYRLEQFVSLVESVRNDITQINVEIGHQTQKIKGSYGNADELGEVTYFNDLCRKAENLIHDWR